MDEKQKELSHDERGEGGYEGERESERLKKIRFDLKNC